MSCEDVVRGALGSLGKATEDNVVNATLNLASRRWARRFARVFHPGAKVHKESYDQTLRDFLTRRMQAGASHDACRYEMSAVLDALYKRCGDESSGETPPPSDDEEVVPPRAAAAVVGVPVPGVPVTTVTTTTTLRKTKGDGRETVGMLDALRARSPDRPLAPGLLRLGRGKVGDPPSRVPFQPTTGGPVFEAAATPSAPAESNEEGMDMEMSDSSSSESEEEPAPLLSLTATILYHPAGPNATDLPFVDLQQYTTETPAFPPNAKVVATSTKLFMDDGERVAWQSRTSTDFKALPIHEWWAPSHAWVVTYYIDFFEDPNKWIAKRPLPKYMVYVLKPSDKVTVRAGRAPGLGLHIQLEVTHGHLLSTNGRSLVLPYHEFHDWMSAPQFNADTGLIRQGPLPTKHSVHIVAPDMTIDKLFDELKMLSKRNAAAYPAGGDANGITHTDW